MTAAHIPSKHEIETFSGRFVDTFDPRAETITVEDIAHALSLTCRYGGHCARFYSVAEHAVAVSVRLERQGFGLDTIIDGLHHDSAEAYLGDIPRPLKPLLGDMYALLTCQMDKVIAEALDIRGDFDNIKVKEADNWLLFVEARHLLPSRGAGWLEGSQNAGTWGLDNLPSRIVTPDYWQDGLDPEVAEGQFLDRHYALLYRKGTT